MKGFKALTVLAALLVSTSANAVKIPLPDAVAANGTTLNVAFQLQPWVLITENGTPDGTSPSVDFFIRRARLLINGDVNNNFSYLLQFDSPNLGKRGDIANATNSNASKAIVQDAWIGWAPFGITGGSVLYIDAGLLLMPISRQMLTTTTNFTQADVHTDSFRLGSVPGLNANQSGFRENGVSIRGWALDKHLGFRGGVYQGQREASLASCGAACGNPGLTPNPKSLPRLAAFLNYSLVGTEDGGWLYSSMYFSKTPIVSVNAAVTYQSQSIQGPNGLTDSSVTQLGAFVEYPFSDDNELVFQVSALKSNNGTGSANTGLGGFVDLGFRMGNLEPYVTYETFMGDTASANACNGGVCGATQSAESRIAKLGLNYYIDKNKNHINAEFAVSHGVSSVTSGSALAPRDVTGTVVPGGAFAVAQQGRLQSAALKTFLIHWNLQF